MKKKRGRPFKMEKWLEKLEEVLAEKRIIFLSDQDLRFLVNEKLESKDQISRRTFGYWVKGENHPTAEIGEKFFDIIEGARIQQKLDIGERFLDDPKFYKAGSFLLERKYEQEFNLKKATERINTIEKINIIQITAGSEAQRMLIDNIINTDFTEIKPLRLPVNDNKKEDEDGF